MRPLEWTQLGIVAAAVLVPVVFGRRLRRGRMAVLLCVVAAAQVLLEGVRWQLLPLEVATVMLAGADALREDRRVRGFQRFRRGALGSVGVILLGVLPAVLPVPVLPAPSGPFEVGTATFELVDVDRPEIYGLDPPEEGEEPAEAPPRRIVVQVWYPAEPDGADPVVWNPDLDVVGPALARRLGFPGFFLGHTDDVPSHSQTDAAPLPGRFPVILSSHGWTGFRTINLNQVESLASHGFIVIAPDHTYGSIAVRFPSDGSVVEYDERALPPEEDVDPDDYQEAAEVLVETFTDDLLLVLNELGEGSAFGELATHADLDKVGVFGHSTGGGAAARLCLEDARCDAILGLDAWVNPIPDRVVAREFQVPSLFMRSDEWVDTPNDRRLRGLAERSPSLSYWIAIEGAGHNDFVMTPLFSPIAHRLGLKGPISSDRVIPIVDEYLVGFFERYLLGVGGSGLDQPPPPEVEFEVIP
ncbi:MAG: dienelactone hydrolase family protein [Acidimicrobiia bacterium]|nr:dienelactone hydrolase family protein [Acidimicrobiia bacterium]MDH4309661.1 dienelactone hydrolase family protein [Acidimicrobiia bacterium]